MRDSHGKLNQESIPVIRMRRPSSVRPCYRSWTTLQKNVLVNHFQFSSVMWTAVASSFQIITRFEFCKCRYVEDDPVLRAIPYFGDNDNGRLDFLERGYERILDDAVPCHWIRIETGREEVRVGEWEKHGP